MYLKNDSNFTSPGVSKRTLSERQKTPFGSLLESCFDYSPPL
jgi:hypothetical protein